MTAKRKPHALIILDGWGYSETSTSNAIEKAQTPVWDKLWSERPHTLVSGSGNDVGLPDGQMGNSEVGHMNLGAGRIVYQDFTRVTKAIEDGEFFSNPALTKAIEDAASKNKAVHIMGLLSPGGVHSHEDHLMAAIDLAHKKGAQAIYVHGFLDGRDTPPQSAEPSIARFEKKFSEIGCGRVASLIGRYFAMDRDNRWERVESAYQLLTEGVSHRTAATAVAGLAAAYEEGETDEFVKATAVVDAAGQAATIQDGDAVLFMNFRADRAREITRAFVEKDFTGFSRAQVPALAGFVSLTQYAADINTPSAFPPETLENVLGEYLEKLGKTQLRIAETEKYAHVTFFFSGGKEDPFDGETRVLVPSPDVATYDLKPEMSAPEVTDKLVEAITSGEYDAIICNFANGDMVGHTGKFDAAVKAVETLDTCIGRVVEAIESVQGECLITADHGNVEQMLDENSGQPLTAHTCEPVPLVHIGSQSSFLQPGKLSDIAPTLLNLMGLEQPKEMTGSNLLKLD